MPPEDPLSLFHPLLAEWFKARVGTPTPVQAAAWPKIAAGGHVLASAPTGGGKTLTAFLWPLNQLLSGSWPAGATRVLYVSPLKALNSDVQKNLFTPLEELRRAFAESGQKPPNVRALTRSGDTPASDRRAMLRRPPEILITTPESLNLILGSPVARNMLGQLQMVILDEIHAVAGSKRGVLLMCGVERLARLAGEFQRVALSATARPVQTVAAFAAGFCQGPAGRQAREMEIVAPPAKKVYQVAVRFPESTRERAGKGSPWRPMVEALKELIEANRSTLVFTNSRRLAEKLAFKINQDEPAPVAYSHHGSLAKEIRREVEARLKQGGLKAIVATSSLELGIDVGDLDQVALVQSPFSVSSAVQRIGRAGHRVGRASKGDFFPTHPGDIVVAAVLARAVTQGDIEELKPVKAPLDILAQVIISMTGVETWDLDELFEVITRAEPYAGLSREAFDLVLNMLAGRYAATRIRELRPRVYLDRLDNTAKAAKGALLALYANGGAIVDRGYYALRVEKNGAKIGELDEEFVWEAKLGQIFTLGAQNWKVERITHNDMFVSPASPAAMAPPFWRAEFAGRDAHFSRLVMEFLQESDELLERGQELAPWLMDDYGLDHGAALALQAYLGEQRAITGVGLPHAGRVVLEWVESGPGGGPGSQLVIHTFWGGRLNRPAALALEAAWEERFGHALEVFPTDDCLACQLPQRVEAGEIMAMLDPGNLDRLLRQRLAGSGWFGARFREAAGLSLVVTRHKMGQRLPLWMSRLKSQRLLNAVSQYQDFPLVLEAWRACLQDDFDLPALGERLRALQEGRVAVAETVCAAPSPMARAVAWDQINKYMYMSDEPGNGPGPAPAEELLEQVVHSPQARPELSPELVAGFLSKLCRTAPGYAPGGGEELLQWARQRLLIPAGQWRELLAAMERDHGLGEKEALAGAAAKLAWLGPQGADAPLLLALENAPALLAAWQGTGRTARLAPLDGKGQRRPPQGDEPAGEEALLEACLEFFRWHGPFTLDWATRTLGLPLETLADLLGELEESRALASGVRVLGREEDHFCEAQNLASLLRLARAKARPDFSPRPLAGLGPFLARWQGLGADGRGPEDLERVLSRLSGLSAPAVAWESEILPARLAGYQPAWLDAVFAEHGLAWLGGEGAKAAFYFPGELDLARPPAAEGGNLANGPGAALRALFRDPRASYNPGALLEAGQMGVEELALALWAAAWRGEAAAEGMGPLRRGIAVDFKAPAPPKPLSRAARFSRSGARRRGGGIPMAGVWRLLPPPAPLAERLERQELAKEKARLLLDRYGIVAKALLERESPAYAWPEIFDALRLMELAGEVVGGHFFTGLNGPQFASHAALRRLARPPRKERVYWLCATDPASICGLGEPGERPDLPRRTPFNHLCYRGEELVLVSEKSGKSLAFHCPPDDPFLPEYLGVLRHLLNRPVPSLSSLTIETINAAPAWQSPYVDRLRVAFELTVDPKGVTIYRGFGS